jgi:hypothetical protein
MSDQADLRAGGQADPNSRTRSGWRQFPLRVAAIGSVSVVVCLLVYYTYIYIRTAYDALWYPFSLDYGEGIVWQQALLIPGPRMYGPITHAPYIVFHYPPVYHLAVRVVALGGLDILAAGRGVSVASALMLMALCAWLAARALGGRRLESPALAIGCAIAGLLPLEIGPVEGWSMLMRVDLLATCLSFLGVCLVAESIRQPWWLLLAVPVFALSVYTKQTCIAAPIAALAISFTVNRQMTIISTAFGATLGLLSLGWLELVTGGGFITHVLAYNVNRFSLELLGDHLLNEKAYAPLMFVAGSTLAFIWWNDRSPGSVPRCDGTVTARMTVAILGLWFVLATGMLVTVGKVGSSTNYFIEVMCICAVPIGMLAALGSQAALGIDTGWRPGCMRLMLVCVSAGLTAQMVLRRHGHYPDMDNPRLTQIRQDLVREIGQQARPVLSEDMVLLMRAGREVPLEPAIFEELAAKGMWDQRPFLQSLADTSFAFVITEMSDLYTPEVLTAISKAYPSVERIGPYTIHRPVTTSSVAPTLPQH